MANKVPIYYFWDWKSIIGVIVALLFFTAILFFVYNPSILKSGTLATYEGETVAKVVAIESKRRLKQTQEGNKLETLYEISYTYMVDGISYSSRDQLKSNLKVEYYLNEIRLTKKATIKYALRNPERSFIIIE